MVSCCSQIQVTRRLNTFNNTLCLLSNALHVSFEILDAWSMIQVIDWKIKTIKNLRAMLMIKIFGKRAFHPTWFWNFSKINTILQIAATLIVTSTLTTHPRVNSDWWERFWHYESTKSKLREIEIKGRGSERDMHKLHSNTYIIISNVF